MLQSDRTHQADSCADLPFFALSVICSGADLPACCSFRHGLRRATFLREEGFGFPRNPPCLSLRERCRAATERAGSLFEGAGLPPCGKTEGVLQIGKMRMRFDLIRTCSCAAPSVTACAVPPSSGRKALVFRAIQLVSPFGRDVAQRQKGLGSLFEGAGFAAGKD